MRKTTLEIRDECNIRFTDLDLLTRKKLVQSVEFMVPYAKHMPAYKLGRWNGKVSFCTLGASSFLNLLEDLLPVVKNAGYEIEIRDLRPAYDFEFPEIDANYLADVKWPKGHRLEGQSISLEEHQVGAINAFGKNLQALQELSTGAGKTITTAALCRYIEPYGRSIIIVPNKDLVGQTEADMKMCGLDTGVFFGDRKEFGHQHTVCTWQSLGVLYEKSLEGMADISMAEFLEGVVCVLVDECHSAKAEILKKLLTGPFARIPIRWGFTGTVPREKWEFFPLLASLGPVVNQVTPRELQEKGFLADIHIHVLQMLDTVGFSNWQEETKYLTTDLTRLSFISGFIQHITEQEGNTLVLVDRIEAGKALAKLIPGAVFINGSTKQTARKEQYQDINLGDNKVAVATYGVAAVGINIPRLFNLVLLEAGKSNVRVIQSIGRLLRRAKDKDEGTVYDCCSALKFSKKHLTERKKMYDRCEYPFDITKVDYSCEEFSDLYEKLKQKRAKAK